MTLLGQWGASVCRTVAELWLSLNGAPRQPDLPVLLEWSPTVKE